MIKYLKGDATRPVGDDPKIIAHICNDVGGWGRGFVLALSHRWLQPERAYRSWYDGRDMNDFALGAVRFVEIEPQKLWVANLIGQHGIHGVPIRYDAVATGLETVTAMARIRGASVHMPRIGCGLAGGTWDRIEPLILGTLVRRGVAVTVYDLE